MVKHRNSGSTSSHLKNVERDERPQPVSEQHVVISAIQTLHSRLKNEPGEYEFLADFSLVIFDEAHRSIAPTFTSVMEELGLTRYRRQHEPLMLGLTATPYRGHDLEETERLVRRYGTNRLDRDRSVVTSPRALFENYRIWEFWHKLTMQR